MKTLFLLLLSLNAFAQKSPFMSTVEELSIGNAHQVDLEGKVFRGMEPKKLVTELKKLGITDVIIFKNQRGSEVDSEIEALDKLSINSHHIPFFYRDFPDAVEACEQTVEALNLIKKIKSSGGKVYFHCTVGEDRTGVLAGLFRMLDQKWSADKAFKKEMCQNGYSDGNPNKPQAVVDGIQDAITPLFEYLSEKISSGKKLTKAICKNFELIETDLKCN